ncbi:MAG: DHH family phosphoesterase [Patescibacteria group bacterium]
MGSFNKLKAMLQEKERFALVCHIEPDGDAIGSLVAMGEYLRQNGKRASLVCNDDIPNVFQFLVEAENMGRTIPENCDIVILLDNGDFRRTGLVKELTEIKKKGIPIINIDHHSRNDLWRFVSVNHADDRASSTSELIYDILVGVNFQITPRIATALLSGLYNDTGGFRHQNTSKKVLDTASELLKRGAKLKQIIKNIENSHPVSMFKLWGIALNRLKINEKYGFAVSYLKASDLEAVGGSEDDLSGLVNFLNMVPEAKASLLLYESETGKIKGSLRTETNDIDLAHLAGLLGGGGHKKAAGFAIEGRIEEGNNSIRII